MFILRGVGRDGLGWFGLFERFGGLKTLEFLEGAVVVAVGGIDTALKTVENLVLIWLGVAINPSWLDGSRRAAGGWWWRIAKWSGCNGMRILKLA